MVGAYPELHHRNHHGMIARHDHDGVPRPSELLRWIPKKISSDCTLHDNSVTKCRHSLMPARRFTKSMVAAAILGFEEQKRQIDAEIAELRAMGKESGPATPASESGKPSRRKISAASRKKMALAQQKRWAAKKAEAKPKQIKVGVSGQKTVEAKTAESKAPTKAA